jgi:hypothetical protein
MATKQEENRIPAHGCAHVERGARLDAQIQKAQATRRNEMAKRPVVNPSANTLPALSNRAKLALPASLKKQG